MESEYSLRQRLGDSRRWVIKVGSALSTNDGVGLNHSAIETWSRQIVSLMSSGHQIVLVTSGSVAEGAIRLGWKERPHSLPQLQAAAAIGQMGLVRGWDLAFEKSALQAAQVLLTHDDLSDRTRYLNARSTLSTLLELGVVPVINENDTVATAELNLGDNDTLAGLVSNLVEADLMVILTDQSGIMTADPRLKSDAKLVEYASVDDPDLDSSAGSGGAWGRGGMRTKLRAARLAARSATSTIIADGRVDDVLLSIGKGIGIGTLLHSEQEKVTARKQWLAGSLRPSGSLVLDEGACKALVKQGKSLLGVGVVEANGHFSRGDLVQLFDLNGFEIGRGLVNYTSAECQKIIGVPSNGIEERLGFVHEPELVHRDNLLVEGLS
jgi:glutamate 5-kinase